MTLAERCDEIVRLIDATLAEITAPDRPVSDRPVSDRPISDRTLSDLTARIDRVSVTRPVTAGASSRTRDPRPAPPAA